MLVDERVPKNMPTQEVSRQEHSQVPTETPVFQQYLPGTLPDELAATIRTQISEFTAWPGLSYHMDRQDRTHETYSNICRERTCEEFLNSNAYQGWKNRKTRGPSLLYVSGSGTLRSDNHCCKSMGLTLQISCNW